jgi:hypothetical protein
VTKKIENQKAQAPVLGADKEALKDAESAKGNLEEVIAEAEHKGFLGEKTDPTPNERYSLESEDWRTPETDPEAAAEAFKAQRFPDHLNPDLAPGPKEKK